MLLLAKGHYADVTLLKLAQHQLVLAPAALPGRSLSMENNGGICDTLENMKELASQEAHRYAPLWTDRYLDRKIARSCNNEIQFRRGHLSTKMETAPVSGFAREKMAIHALRDY